MSIDDIDEAMIQGLSTRMGELGWDVDRVALMAGVPARSIEDWLAGRVNNMDASELAVVLKALGIDWQDVLPHDVARPDTGDRIRRLFFDVDGDDDPAV